MTRMVEALAHWARRTTTSFSELMGEVGRRPEAPPANPTGPELIYRLRHWPSLPSSMRRADVLRLLSLMSNRMVNRSWMVAHSHVPAAQVDRLLALLERQQALEVIDPRDFAGRNAAND